LVGKGPHLLAVNADHTDELVLLQHRNGHKGPGTAVFCDRRIGAFRRHVCDLDRLHCVDCVKKVRGHQAWRLFAEFRKLPWRVMRRNSPPSTRNIEPNAASQMRVAFASIVSNTGSSVPDEFEMTCSTWEVAICRSSDSESSRVRCCSASNSRTFSIAITAWSAKVVSSSICLSVKGRTTDRVSVNAPIGVPSIRQAYRGRPADRMSSG